MEHVAEKKKSILVAAQNLHIGGVQAALVNYLKELSRDGSYDIDVFAFTGGALQEKLPKNVRLTLGGKCLQLSATSFDEIRQSGSLFDRLLRVFVTAFAKIFGTERFYRLCFRHKKPQKTYDIAVSYFTDVPAGVFNKGTNLYIAAYVTAAEKLAFVHTDPLLSGFDKEYCRRIYKPFDKIVCVSDAVREKFAILLPAYKEKTETRHTVFDADEIQAQAAAYEPFEKGVFDIVTVARVDNASKRIDGIVRLCARLKSCGKTAFTWRIVGDGPDRKNDEALAKELDVAELVRFEGQKENPYPYIAKSDLFALYSAYEGYPLVVGEALILHTPILTTAYAAAKEQIPKDCGVIAQTDEAFFEALCARMDGAVC